MPLFFATLLGLCIGSFLNTLIWRLHEGKSLCRGRSQCPACQKTLRWFELIPLASFLIQAGRCRRCRAKISWQYPLLELATAILFMIGLWQYLFINLLIYWFIASVLLAIFVYDLRYGDIPDQITLPAITFLLLLWLANYFIQRAMGYGLWDMGYPPAIGFASGEWRAGGIWDLFWGIIIGGGFFALQYSISKGRWIGGGDIRLGVLMGVILGWPKILVALFIAYVGGAVISLILIALKKKTLQSAVPFGIFLIPATFVTMFWGQRVVEWYLKLILF